MPKRRRSGGRDGGLAAKHPRKKRLYLVFDDWLWGYSIRKVDLCADADSDESKAMQLLSNVHGDVPRLPPAVFRLAGRIGYSRCLTATFGTKIMAMHPRVPDFGSHPPVPSCVVPVLDVRTRSLRYGPQPEENLVSPIYFPIGDRLFALSSAAFQMLQQQPGGQRWRPWQKLRMPPFSSYVFVSTSATPDHTKERTFTFDSSQEARFKWERNGKWILPFTGRAHFDCELDAWVGLSGDPSTVGHLCASDVPSSSSRYGQCPACKISKEKLFSDDPAEKHVGATLVYIGGGKSHFCLIQCICIEDDMDADRNVYISNDEDLDRPYRFLVRLTMFSLKYDKNGHLTIGNSGRVRYFRVPKGCSEFSLNEPVAFWM